MWTSLLVLTLCSGLCGQFDGPGSTDYLVLRPDGSYEHVFSGHGSTENHQRNEQWWVEHQGQTTLLVLHGFVWPQRMLAVEHPKHAHDYLRHDGDKGSTVLTVRFFADRISLDLDDDFKGFFVKPYPSVK